VSNLYLALIADFDLDVHGIVVQKILTLPRSDSAICFAGDTQHAYPLMLQMVSAINFYPRSRDRAMDLFDMKGHTLRVFNQMREFIHDLPVGIKQPEQPEATFLLGGYSWVYKRFVIWKLYYQRGVDLFTYHQVKKWKGIRGRENPRFGKRCIIAFAGDKEHVFSAQEQLMSLLNKKYGGEIPCFDMEPFEVLCSMLRKSNDHSSIGGPPQLLKIFEHMNCKPYGVFWPSREAGKISILGRPLIGYEKSDVPVIDPDTLVTSKLG
jgi:hypothetical protein